MYETMIHQSTPLSRKRTVAWLRHGVCWILWLNLLQAAETSPKPDAQVLYKQTSQGPLRLNIFYPEGHRSDAKKPAILFFFGGGWVGGSPTQFHPQCDYLASRGMVAISAAYRTRNDHGTPPSACVEDGKSAIRWLRAHAAELGVDPDRIVAGGGSAGGHVAAATATVETFDNPEDPKISALPNALVLFNPVYDNGPKGYGHDRVMEYWRDFSPMHLIHDGMPPAIVFLGTEDSLIPVVTAKAFQHRMQALGIRSDLHLYEGQKHGFFNQNRYHQTLHATDRFLRSLGYLEGLPDIPHQAPSDP